MLSFIVIGRNESWKLTQCFQSVFEIIEKDNLLDCEVIYVDSKSTDDSISRAKHFPKIKIFQITGKYNAAIARNIGAKESKGDVLFFIDGDMEVLPEFVPLVYQEKQGLLYDFVSGNWINYKYDSDWNLLSESKARNLLQNTKEITTGGLFLIKREHWFRIGGMKNKLKFNEDLDLGLRMANKGMLLVRKKEILAVHHAIPYNDISRMWKQLLTGAQLYRIVLLRDNILNKYQWKMFIRSNYTFFALGLIILLTVVYNNCYFLLIYFAMVLTRSIFRGERSLRLILSNLLYFSLYELSMFFAIFLFWPVDHEERYKQIKN